MWVLRLFVLLIAVSLVGCGGADNSVEMPTEPAPPPTSPPQGLGAGATGGGAQVAPAEQAGAAKAPALPSVE